MLSGCVHGSVYKKQLDEGAMQEIWTIIFTEVIRIEFNQEGMTCLYRLA